MTTTDLTAADVVWDLAPLLPAPDDAGIEQLARRGRRQGRRARRVPRPDRRARRRRPRRVHAGTRRRARPHRPGRQLRRPRLRDRHHRSRARRAHAEGRRAVGDDRHQAAVLRARVGRARRRPGRVAARRRAPRVRQPPPAFGAPLPAAPAERARRGRAHREVGHRHAARGSACSTSRSRRSPSSSTARPTTLEAGALAAAAPDREVRQAAAEAVTAGLAPGTAHARVRAQHVARRQVDRRPHAPLRLVDRESQPLERGERRVGAGARRRGAGPLRDPAALVHAQGAAARHRPARRLRPDGVDRRRREQDRLGTRRKDLVLDAYGSFSGELADTARQFFDNAWIDAPARPGKRPGAFCAYTVPSHHPYLLLNWTVAPARRAHARARARSRPARVPGARAGRVPPDHAAHARRDRVGVRRDGHVRPLARDRDRSRRTARRCSRRTSKIRSRPCSVRSR